MPVCLAVDLGVMNYDDALNLQTQLVPLRQRDQIEDLLLLLEHPPVITEGVKADNSMLKTTPELLEEMGIAYRRVNRGGYHTVHAPGQLVGYPIRLVSSFDEHLNGIERILTGITAAYTDKATMSRVIPWHGIWYRNPEDQRYYKFGSRGVELKYAYVDDRAVRVSMHGFAFDVNTDLRYYRHIDPCGFERPVTGTMKDIEREIRGHYGGVTNLSSIVGHEIDMKDVKRIAVQEFGKAFGAEMRVITPEELTDIAAGPARLT